MPVGLRHLKIEINFGLGCEKAICADGSEHVHQKVVYTAVSEHLVSQRINDRFIAVIDIDLGKDKVYKLSFLITQQRQLESNISSHRAFPFLRDTLEYLFKIAVGIEMKTDENSDNLCIRHHTIHTASGCARR